MVAELPLLARGMVLLTCVPCLWVGAGQVAGFGLRRGMGWRLGAVRALQRRWRAVGPVLFWYVIVLVGSLSGLSGSSVASGMVRRISTGAGFSHFFFLCTLRGAVWVFRLDWFTLRGAGGLCWRLRRRFGTGQQVGVMLGAVAGRRWRWCRRG